MKWCLYGDSLYKECKLKQPQRGGVSGLGFCEPRGMMLLTGKSEVTRRTSAGSGFIHVQLAYLCAIRKMYQEYFNLRTDSQRRKEALT